MELSYLIEILVVQRITWRATLHTSCSHYATVTNCLVWDSIHNWRRWQCTRQILLGRWGQRENNGRNSSLGRSLAKYSITIGQL